ncbi:MAG TPA: hypothetical protein VKV26_16745 [Dehalococcoidia bacterium]|nr:hypothetical protein [Dehalococcoidia bacterium]
MPNPQWFTLIRFDGRPECLTGVCQARTPKETLQLLDDWQQRFPVQTTVVFDPHNRPVERQMLEWLSVGSPPDRRQTA